MRLQTRSALCVTLAAALLSSGLTGLGAGRDAVAQDAPPALGEKSTRTVLLRAAIQAVGKGHVDSARDLLSVAEMLGHEERDIEKARATVEKKAAKLKGGRKRADSVAKAVARSADELAAALDSADDATRVRLAEALVILDAESEVAHQALGHVRVDGGWAPAAVAPLLERRKEIERALVDAHALSVDLEVRACDHDVLKDVTGEKGLTAVWRNVHVHAMHLPQAKLERILRMAVRTGALSRFVRFGKIEYPNPNKVVHLTVLPSVPQYRDAMRAKIAAGQLDKNLGDVALEATSWITAGNHRLSAPSPDAMLACVLFTDLHRREWWRTHTSAFPPQSALQLGHVNWCALAMLGIGRRYVGVVDPAERASGTSDAHDANAAAEAWRLGNAGLLGARALMRYLVQRGEDPAWSQSFQDQIAKIEGPAATKTVFVAQYLHESQRMQQMLDDTAGKACEAPTFEAALGTDLAELERVWREWMLAPSSSGGVLQRLGGDVPQATGPSEEESALLAYLDDLRTSALTSTGPIEPLGLDPELSDGCRVHANYLHLNPEQQLAWPDAHEEWPDKPGFEPRGSWAGLHSVIAPGRSTGRDAVDAWMGTFYHRLPLLDPGVVRIGWGLEHDVAVLDAASMRGEYGWNAWACWPPRDAAGVPRSFVPELPNPVPGEDQSKWGYPVTVQWFLGYDQHPDVEVRLFAGSGTSGDPVDCHVSTPRNPTNSDVAPSDAICLIPKRTLAAKSTYTVLLRGMPGEGDIVWSFRTGP